MVDYGSETGLKAGSDAWSGEAACCGGRGRAERRAGGRAMGGAVGKRLREIVAEIALVARA